MTVSFDELYSTFEDLLQPLHGFQLIWIALSKQSVSNVVNDVRAKNKNTKLRQKKSSTSEHHITTKILFNTFKRTKNSNLNFQVFLRAQVI